jgi:hypothetical protein
VSKHRNQNHHPQQEQELKQLEQVLMLMLPQKRNHPWTWMQEHLQPVWELILQS